MRSTRRSRPSTFPALARQQCPYGNSHWRLPEGLVESDAALRAPWKRPVPREWLAEQRRLAVSPGYLAAHLTALRAQVAPGGQREVLLDRLYLMKMPTLVVWGGRDRVFPESQAREAAARLQEGSLAIIPDCGHMPHVECPDRFLAALDGFLGGQIHR